MRNSESYLKELFGTKTHRSRRGPRQNRGFLFDGVNWTMNLAKPSQKRMFVSLIRQKLLTLFVIKLCRFSPLAVALVSSLQLKLQGQAVYFSQFEHNNYGVPHGSILGPIACCSLFMLMIYLITLSLILENDLCMLTTSD